LRAGFHGANRCCSRREEAGSASSRGGKERASCPGRILIRHGKRGGGEESKGPATIWRAPRGAPGGASAIRVALVKTALLIQARPTAREHFITHYRAVPKLRRYRSSYLVPRLPKQLWKSLRKNPGLAQHFEHNWHKKGQFGSIQAIGGAKCKRSSPRGLQVDQRRRGMP